MSTYAFNQKTFVPTPPEKGSFPLDHEGACKMYMIEYMRCLFNNNNDNTMCRSIAKDYLACRMDNELMRREEWEHLGFADKVKET